MTPPTPSRLRRISLEGGQLLLLRARDHHGRDRARRRRSGWAPALPGRSRRASGELERPDGRPAPEEPRRPLRASPRPRPQRRPAQRVGRGDASRPRRRSRGATLPRNATSPAGQARQLVAPRSWSTGKAAAITPFSTCSLALALHHRRGGHEREQAAAARRSRMKADASLRCGERLLHPGDAGEIAAGLLARGAVAAGDQQAAPRRRRRPCPRPGSRRTRGRCRGRSRRHALLGEQGLGAGLLRQRAHLARAGRGLRVAVALPDRGHLLEVGADLLLGDARCAPAGERDGRADRQHEERGGAQEQAGREAEAARALGSTTDGSSASRWAAVVE